MYEILLGLFLVVALALIGVILLQQGKGADMGASFGSGASNTVFGSAGSGNFLTKSTWVLAGLSLVLLLALGRMATHHTVKAEPVNDVFTAPVAPAPAPASDIPAMPATAPSTDVPMAPPASTPASDVPTK